MLLKASSLPLLCGVGLILQGTLCCAAPPAALAAVTGAQSRTAHRPDAQTQLLEYYRRYPDRYILVANQTWNYDYVVRGAFHSLTLRNTAGVGYCDIEVSFNYQAAGGKSMQTQVVKVQGILEAYQKLDVRRVKVKGAPERADTVLVRVVKATVCR
jgi:hypothetical protein